MNTSFGLALEALGTGLPLLILHLVVTLVLLALGVACYMAITPFNERRMVEEGNPAAGTVLAGTIIALSIPLAATLATSAVVLDIVLWGIVALILQLIAFLFAARLMPGLQAQIEGRNVAAALTLVGLQIAVALLNAAAMAG
jgi:putative membrane protein